MAFVIQINTDGSAFDGDGYGPEVRRLLKFAGDKLENGYDEGWLLDINGNRVGAWSSDGEPLRWDT